MQLQDIGLLKKLAIAFILVGLVLLIGHELELYLPDLEVGIQELGAFAPLGFITLFVVLTPFFCISRCALFCGRLIISNRCRGILYRHRNLSGIGTYFCSGPLFIACQSPCISCRT